MKVASINLIATICFLIGIDLKAQQIDFTANYRFSESNMSDAISLTTPLNIKLSDMQLSLIYESGKEYGTFKIVEIIELEPDEYIRSGYALKILNDSFVEYIVYQITASNKPKISIPFTKNGYVHGYTSFIKI